VLDIGCSTGLLDLLMAVKHQPKLIIAVDIDHHLIKTAIDNMQKLINDSE
jgi:ribosomal protein L11 methylase PrmA